VGFDAPRSCSKGIGGHASGRDCNGVVSKNWIELKNKRQECGGAMSDGSLRTMPKSLDPFRFLLISVAGWMNQQQRDAIEYLREENRVLRTQFGGRRLRFTDDQRRSLAAKAKLVGRKLLGQLSTIVTPETLLKWHRDLIACKYDGSKRRHPGRPSTGKEIEELVVRMAMENESWGLSPNSRRLVQSRLRSEPQHDCQYFET
jgi:hypothetical protein